jgi:putative adhesin
MLIHGLRRWHGRSLTTGTAGMALATLILTGCGLPVGPLGIKASETWTHTYPLSKTGEVTVVNTNGRIEVEGVEAATVEVEALKIASGATDELARDLLPRIPIEEHATPDFVSIETRRLNGFLIGASYEVRFKVKMPRGATIRATTVNGGVSITGMDGRVITRTTNGGILATQIGGGIEARSVNGGVRVQFASTGSEPADLRTVNGGVHVALPPTAKATVSATWVNGGINLMGLPFDVQEQAKRRFEGRLNGGGAKVEVATVNGGITIGSELDRTRPGRGWDEPLPELPPDLHERR